MSQFTQELAPQIWALLPELVLVAGIIGLLLARFQSSNNTVLSGTLAMAFLAVAGAAALTDIGQGQGLTGFFGMLRMDTFAALAKVLVIAAAMLVVWLAMSTPVAVGDDATDFFVVLLGAVLGMCLMTAANDLVMVLIAMEMASLPSYCLAGFLRKDRLAGEASLKYVVFGSAAAGIMLYGITLVAGYYGTTKLPELAAAIGQVGADSPTVLGLGLLFIFAGLAFKLSLVPFHFWCPDVFQGASAEVAAFLSVASKGAAFAMALRIVLTLTGVWDGRDDLAFLHPYAVPALGVVAAVTATFGNLAAYTQTNMKRLLAYSTIAHAGYMLMGLAALSRDGAHAILLYLAIYILMNLGAFAVVGLVRDSIGSEDMRDYAGMGRRNPLLAATMSIFLLSLFGLPPLAGFAAKFRLFYVLADERLFWLLTIGVVNTLLSLYYYAKVLKTMYLDDPDPDVADTPVTVGPSGTAFVVATAFLVVAIGIYWDPLARWIGLGANAIAGG